MLMAQTGRVSQKTRKSPSHRSCFHVSWRRKCCSSTYGTFYGFVLKNQPKKKESLKLNACPWLTVSFVYEVLTEETFIRLSGTPEDGKSFVRSSQDNTAPPPTLAFSTGELWRTTEMNSHVRNFLFIFTQNPTEASTRC